ncbi:MAG: hypothetical protein E4H01_02230 [Lysobacterales bacterium]|nr:MAG: hypothetical protein E4H01_02230 [Xanthomonadales bacterium]
MLSQSDVAAVQSLVRHRVLRLFERNGLLNPEAAENMREWRHGGGFSLNAGVAVEADDRGGLERLLRYCVRPAFSARASDRHGWRECRGLSGTIPACFALPRPSLDSSVERLSWRVEGERVVYRLPKPRPDGTQHVELAVSELFDRLATLIPPPRCHRHRHRYCHRSLEMDAPDWRNVRPARSAEIVELPCAGGLHHYYLPKAA